MKSLKQFLLVHEVVITYVYGILTLSLGFLYTGDNRASDYLMCLLGSVGIYLLAVRSVRFTVRSQVHSLQTHPIHFSK